MTPEAATYLDEALNYIQLYSVKRANMDWNTIRSEALARISTARTPADTYPTIRWVLSCLGDHHSFLLTPQGVKNSQEGMVSSPGFLAVYPEGVIIDVHQGSPAELAGLQVRDIIETINGEPRTHLDRVTFTRALYASALSLTVKRAGQESIASASLHKASYKRAMKPQGWTLEPGIGYLELPSLAGNEALAKAYAHTAQQLIRNMDQAAICHWIIDLRRNRGGNMWPMVVGVCPLLGNGEYGFFLSPEGKQTSWTANITRSIKTLLAEPYILNHPASSIAVLTSRLTCSAGEFTTLAFRGDPRVRSFGEPTAGLPTANRSKPLRDGAKLILTVALGADRTGRSYNGPIVPDQPVDNNWTLFQTERDPVLVAAVEWLRMQ